MANAYWIGTIFEPNLGEHTLRELYERGGITTAMGQVERCPDTGREHLQFALRLQSRRRLAFLKQLHGTAHWEPKKGTVPELGAYVTKEDTRITGPWTIGEPWPTTGCGRRSDLEALQQDLQQGRTDTEISETHFELFLRYRRGIAEYRLLHLQPRRWEMEVYILWGDTGTGKTRQVYNRAENESLSVYCLQQPPSGSHTIWFSGYTGQEILLIDDFYSWLPFSWILKLLDRYPMMVPLTTGASVNFTSKTIYITSNQDPREWYPNIDKNSQQWAAFKRRITKIEHFSKLM